MPVLSSVDREKFGVLRLTHVATRFEELLKERASHYSTPEEVVLTAVDVVVELRRTNGIEKPMRQSGFPIPDTFSCRNQLCAGTKKRHGSDEELRNPRP